MVGYVGEVEGGGGEEGDERVPGGVLVVLESWSRIQRSLLPRFA